MAQVFQVHPKNPQVRLLRQVAQLMREGGCAAIPTDSSYALVARLDDKSAADKLRQLRGLDERHHLTLLCRDLAEIGHFARVDNSQYRLLKLATPGPWTFVLEATKEVPRRLSHPSRKTIGIRVPDCPIVRALIEEMGEPLMSTTLIPAGEDDALTEADDIELRYRHELAAIVDGGACPGQPTTVLDLTGEAPSVTRRGQGDPAKLGLV
ncbi:MAG: L-threonylcarbamoyladenylate synthase [Pigmentiphaga sp.]|nr:L-threonylcarbamoyladenylate synthase [Pigmentiphaga sp.]